MSNDGRIAMPINSMATQTPRSTAFHVVLAAALLVLILSFSLLAPILLSFLLVLLISLALNPLISRMRSWTGGRKIPTGLVAAGLITGVALLGWALFGPMKASILNISVAVPVYWERLQKPLIKMEQKAVLFEEKLQAEVRTEIARDDQAMGTPESHPRPPQAASAQSGEEPQSLRSSLMNMVQGALGGFTAVAFNGAQILMVLVTVFLVSSSC
ncbi:hypothetical protein DPPLL_22320 [Desulfofustis limnaeus]|uniref:AI-2E family transporter n=2 Tax=Desulfofustis limnaeus TaxID=2740163 RepID=A0ABN6M9R6_9BACT|nr:hypothetical protein DPPLL_22320 [Desulfofustis limnaeus]